MKFDVLDCDGVAEVKGGSMPARLEPYSEEEKGRHTERVEDGVQ